MTTKVSGLVVALGSCISSLVLAAAPLYVANTPSNRVIDTAGRTLYIIDLSDTARTSPGEEVPAAERARFHERHHSKAVNAVHALERFGGFQMQEMTSLVGLSVGAYLTPDQVESVRRYPFVTSVSESVKWKSSAMPSPPWTDRTTTVAWGATEIQTWGKTAVGGTASGRWVPGTQRVPIYVIDSGVGGHEDLAVSYLYPIPAVTPVGCYAHASHVAGIIAAHYYNGGVAGIFAGATIKSVTAATATKYDPQDISHNCADPESMNSNGMIYALDAIRWDMRNDPYYPGTAAVVNISMNQGDGRFRENHPLGTVYQKMAYVAQPSPAENYHGALIVQSAGNDYDDACYYAYAPASMAANPADGVLVVGGVDANGAPVVPPYLNGNAYINTPYSGNAEASNYGACVEIWAPSMNIMSSWAGPSGTGFHPDNPATWPQRYTVYTTYAQLSGTSMAAPHVAGIAAQILYTQPTLNSIQLEAQVRQTAKYRGQVDAHCATGCPVMHAASIAVSALDAVVEHSYTAILGRGSDAGGKSYWLDEIERLRDYGADPRETYRVLDKTFFASAEYASRDRSDAGFVEDLYQAFLNRSTANDLNGLSYWLGQLGSGFVRDAAIVTFAKSAEFDGYMTTAVGGGNQRAEISMLMDAYRSILARLPDHGGLIYYLGRLRTAQCNGYSAVAGEANGMLYAFFNSGEYFNRGRSNQQYIADLYDAFFARAIDRSGYDYWVSQVPTLGRNGVLGYFFGSSEWSSRINAIAAESCNP